MRRSLIAVLTIILVGGIAFQALYSLRETPEPVARRRLADLVPREATGFAVTEERLGATEVVDQTVLRTLNLDDYVYRRFAKGAESFTIYAAYWAPGRMPTRLVASHTPDRCWTENGMRCVETEFRKVYGLDGRNLLPAEYRVFTPPADGAKTFVAYWHIVDGRLYDYGGRFNAIPHPWLWWKDTLAQAVHGAREQLFVRVTSTSLLEGLWKNPDFKHVMKTLADVGLWQADSNRQRTD